MLGKRLLLATSILLRGSYAFLPISSGTRRCHFASLQSESSSDDGGADSTRPKICVLGGGFGGINTALTLADLPWPDDWRPEITLVDKKERFVFLPLLYELCVDGASPEEVAPTYKSLLGDTDVEFIQRDIEGVDVSRAVVHTNTVSTTGRAERDIIEYDALVVATGAGLNLGFVPGAEQFALPFYTVEQCYDLRRRFNLLDCVSEARDEPLEIVVIGGGYSGVELSLNVLERLGSNKPVKVTLVHRGKEVLQYATAYNKKTGQDKLKAAGVKTMVETNVIEILPSQDAATSDDVNANAHKCRVKVSSRDDEETILDADLLLWTAGATASNTQGGVLNSVLPRDENGRIVTGKFMRAKGIENVFALGDCSRAAQVPFAATAQVAMQQAPVTAWNVFATLMNKSGRKDTSGEQYKMLPFQYLNLGEMMTLGSNDASVSSLGGLVKISGPGASVLRRLIYAARMPTAQQGIAAALETTERSLLSPNRGAKKGEKRIGKVIAWK